MSDCPCLSGNSYAECCEPYIKGVSPAPTAESMMRARYSAYVNVEMDYILDTTHPEQRADYDATAAKEWAEKSEWLGLEILDTQAGKEEDEKGAVEFVAHFIQGDERMVHHERAHFQKEDGKWFFYDGEPVTPQTFVREAPKVGRNEPCPCGSGKKFKKCCIDK